MMRHRNFHFALARSCRVAIVTPFQKGQKMTVRAVHVAVLLALMPSAGCGTVANLADVRPEDGGVSPFGGVRHDVACMQNRASCCKTLFCAADLPFSFVGDVVTWPYTATYTYINEPVPTPPVTQAMPDGRPQTYPAEVLPPPKKLP
jgi:uncharacterized protein YceK